LERVPAEHDVRDPTRRRLRAERLRGRRGRHLSNGNALAGQLLKSAIDSGVTLRNNARARQLS